VAQHRNLENPENLVFHSKSTNSHSWPPPARPPKEGTIDQPYNAMEE